MNPYLTASELHLSQLLQLCDHYLDIIPDDSPLPAWANLWVHLATECTNELVRRTNSDTPTIPEVPPLVPTFPPDPIVAYQVQSSNGLNLRTQPNTRAEVRKTLPNAYYVETVGESISEGAYTWRRVLSWWDGRSRAKGEPIWVSMEGWVAIASRGVPYAKEVKVS